MIFTKVALDGSRAGTFCCVGTPFGLLRLGLSADDLREASRVRFPLLSLRTTEGSVISTSSSSKSVAERCWLVVLASPNPAVVNSVQSIAGEGGRGVAAALACTLP